MKISPVKKLALIVLAACCHTTIALSQNSADTVGAGEPGHYRQALVSFEDFKNLVTEVEAHRAARLISLDSFLQMSREKNVVILDTRSDFRYKRKHLKGAIHLDFTDFTQSNLRNLLPADPATKILIYCNNNFEGDQVNFASKVARPQQNTETQLLANRKPVMLALNIPTYINLYGYGYRNIYELNELVNVKDPRIRFEGSEVK
jgi:rhodanese-related sulfurtransferase